MINCTVIMGRLTATPELRTTGTGTSVTSFTVAVEKRFAKQGEERGVDYIDVVAWKQTAEFVTRYFTKGSMIAIQGSIQTRMYEDKNGNKRKAVEVVADNVSFCGEKKATISPEADGAGAGPTFATAGAGEFEEIPDDDFPF